MTTARAFVWTYDVADKTAWPYSLNKAGSWFRGTMVRTGDALARVPMFPTRFHVMFDKTDPLTWYVKGAGYQPDRQPVVSNYGPFFPV